MFFFFFFFLFFQSCPKSILWFLILLVHGIKLKWASSLPKLRHEESQAEAHTCFTKVNSKSTSQFVEFLNINKIFCKFFLCKNYFSKINFSLVNHILNCNIF